MKLAAIVAVAAALLAALVGGYLVYSRSAVLDRQEADQAHRQAALDTTATDQATQASALAQEKTALDQEKATLDQEAAAYAPGQICTLVVTGHDATVSLIGPAHEAQCQAFEGNWVVGANPLAFQRTQFAAGDLLCQGQLADGTRYVVHDTGGHAYGAAFCDYLLRHS